MIVFCEECGQKHFLEPDKVSEEVRCTICNEYLRIGKKASPNRDSKSPGVRLWLELRYQDNVVELNKNHPRVTLGRLAKNDIVVRDPRASRTHAHFDYRDGQVILADQSKNGTYVNLESQTEMKLKKGELPIFGSGFIGLGKKLPADSPEAIHFSLHILRVLRS